MMGLVLEKFDSNCTVSVFVDKNGIKIIDIKTYGGVHIFRFMRTPISIGYGF